MADDTSDDRCASGTSRQWPPRPLCVYPRVQSGLRSHWPTASAVLGAPRLDAGARLGAPPTASAVLGAPRLDAGSAGTTNDSGAHRKVIGWPPPKDTVDSSHTTAPATAPWPSPPSPWAAAQTPPPSPPPPPPLSAAAADTTEAEVEAPFWL